MIVYYDPRHSGTFLVFVHLRGGDLTIRYTDETVFMTGAATTVFKGEIEI